jgi:hypothetical protein
MNMLLTLRISIILPVLIAITPAIAGNKNKDLTIQVSHRDVHIQYPQGEVKGTILMLPGWNFPASKTCENSTFCKQALEAGFVLISPEMGKSLYASAVYPETRKDWAAFPQMRFLTDSLQPYLQKTYHLLEAGGNNFVYGISTGARGGALLLERTNNIYRAGALLSGDYDQCLDPTDNLMNSYYGAYATYKERWEGADNPARQASRITCPLYLGHGTADAVVLCNQTVNFCKVLQDLGKKPVFTPKEKAGHNYSFWGGETQSILQFFSMCLK